MILRKYLKMKRSARNVTTIQVNEENNLAVHASGILAEKIYRLPLRTYKNKFQPRMPRGIGDDAVEPARHIQSNYGFDGVRDAVKLHMKNLDAAEPRKQTESDGILLW